VYLLPSTIYRHICHCWNAVFVTHNIQYVSSVLHKHLHGLNYLLHRDSSIICMHFVKIFLSFILFIHKCWISFKMCCSIIKHSLCAWTTAQRQMHQGLVLRPSCLPEKMGLSKNDVNQEWYSYLKKGIT